MRILLVEDHVGLVPWVARALEKSRYTVERSLNASMPTHGSRPSATNLVILDLSLARMDGTTSCGRCGRGARATPC